jgi:hypothetical protein
VEWSGKITKIRNFAPMGRIQAVNLSTCPRNRASVAHGSYVIPVCLESQWSLGSRSDNEHDPMRAHGVQYSRLMEATHESLDC